ncbi:MAG: glycosyltransferase family 2 protein [Gammaproteobacteria bacterium]|nr:glycosyltransferase family 2 protein [Gammaproteobacteria bacterium]
MDYSISVVIPAFNAKSTIDHAIASALHQSCPPKEIIVVDDGSTDNTVEVVRSWGEKIQRVSKPNQGSAVARQNGSALSTSDYIAYLDADDWWPEGKLAMCQEILAAEHIDFLLADLQRAHWGESPEQYLPRNSTFFPWVGGYLRRFSQSNSMSGLYKFEAEHGLNLLLEGFPVYPSTALVRRAVIDEVGGWDARFRRCQDFDIGLRIARQFPLHYFDRVQAILGLHSGNDESQTYVIKQTEGDIKVLLAHLDESGEDMQYKALLSKALAKKYCNLGYTLRQVGDCRRANSAYKSAMDWPGKRAHAFLRWCWTSFH